jgi:hypothetical protein
MMRLLHHALADPAYLPVPHNLEVEGPQDALATILYSDIGSDFYSRCPPFTGTTTGWDVVGAKEVSWLLSDVVDEPRASSQTVDVFEKDIPELARLDADETLAELSSSSSSLSSGQEGPPARAAVFPIMGREVIWLLASAKYTAAELFGRAGPQVVGVRLLGSGSDGATTTPSSAFALWTFDYPKKSLNILRLRCTTKAELADILAAAAREAKRQEFTRIAAWNVDEKLLVDTEKRNEERMDHLSSMAWYGPGNDRPTWWRNERYSWC